MAVTITTVPTPAIRSAYRPIPWEVETTRFDDIDNQFTVVAINNSGSGTCRMTTSAAHGFVIGDLVLVEDAAETRYNGLQRVTFIPSGSLFDTNKAFFASEGSTPVKTVTLKNNNFQIRADIYAYNGATVAIASVADNGGNIRVTTSTVHGLAANDRIEIRNTTSYNQLHVVAAIVSTTVYDVTFAFVADETGNTIKSIIRGTKRQKAVVVGTSNLFQFDPVGILRAQLSYDIKALNTSGVDTPNDNSIEDYFIDFTEEHDDEDGLLQEYANTEGDTKHVLNITHQHQETQDTDPFLMDGTDKLWLTNAPRTMKKAFAEEFQLSFITDAINVTVRFERFDNNGASLGVSTTAAEIIRQRGIFGVNSTVFTLAHSRIEIFVWDEDTSSQISERINFTRDDLCYRDPVRFHWLNRLGGFDAFTFTGDRRETVKAKKTTYQKDLGDSFAVQDRGTTTLGVRANEQVQVWSEFLPEETQRWLTELATSPEVYIEVGDNLVPVDSNSVNMPFVRHSKLQQLKVRFNMPDLIIQEN